MTTQPPTKDACPHEAAGRWLCCAHCRSEEGGCDWNNRHVAPCCEEAYEETREAEADAQSY